MQIKIWDYEIKGLIKEHIKNNLGIEIDDKHIRFDYNQINEEVEGVIIDLNFRKES